MLELICIQWVKFEDSYLHNERHLINGKLFSSQLSFNFTVNLSKLGQWQRVVFLKFKFLFDLILFFLLRFVFIYFCQLLSINLFNVAILPNWKHHLVAKPIKHIVIWALFATQLIIIIFFVIVIVLIPTVWDLFISFFIRIFFHEFWHTRNLFPILCYFLLVPSNSQPVIFQ